MRLIGLIVIAASCAAWAQPLPPLRYQEDEDKKPWEETQVQLPAYPPSQGLLPFRVTPSELSFFVDPAAISVGTDGIVRYTVVIRSPGGALNVAYEGIRCGTWQARAYAYGRPDGTWSPVRSDAWSQIRPKPIAYRDVLAKDFFCPQRKGMVDNAAEAVDALRRGRHPNALN